MPTRRQQLAAAWDELAKAGRDGPLDARTTSLVELAIAIGTGDRDAVRATHQRATHLAHGEEIDQVVALAAPIVGRFAAESVYGWLGLEPPAAPGVPVRGNPKPTDA
ncbi:MAG TPA: carboxymuconolactone decarboxylase family protein [Kofleriaceae bacterium]|nr:carboxymuconolactone decarboxylase family protein [Kofleriaceae bacterium]